MIEPDAFGYAVETTIIAKERFDSDVNDFSKSADGHLSYFPVGTEHADFMTKAFSDKGIGKTKKQVTEGAGWLVITSDGNSVKDLIETGRRFQRMALTAREKMIAIHPMTQVLEEKNGQKHVKDEHEELETDVTPQFMLRVGYLNKYPDPVSLRRPVEWFVRS